MTRSSSPGDPAGYGGALLCTKPASAGASVDGKDRRQGRKCDRRGAALTRIAMRYSNAVPTLVLVTQSLGTNRHGAWAGGRRRVRETGGAGPPECDEGRVAAFGPPALTCGGLDRRLSPGDGCPKGPKGPVMFRAPSDEIAGFPITAVDSRPRLARCARSPPAHHADRADAKRAFRVVRSRDLDPETERAHLASGLWAGARAVSCATSTAGTTDRRSRPELARPQAHRGLHDRWPDPRRGVAKLRWGANDRRICAPRLCPVFGQGDLGLPIFYDFA